MSKLNSLIKDIVTDKVIISLTAAGLAGITAHQLYRLKKRKEKRIEIKKSIEKKYSSDYNKYFDISLYNEDSYYIYHEYTNGKLDYQVVKTEYKDVDIGPTTKGFLDLYFCSFQISSSSAFETKKFETVISSHKDLDSAIKDLANRLI
jgi:hypothetical protein